MPPTVEPGCFDTFLRQARERPPAARRRTAIVVASLAAHGLLLAAGSVASFWQVEPLTAPTVAVTFLTAPPPPPPPPPPARKQASPRPRIKPLRPIIQPTVTQPPSPEPPQEEPEEPEPDTGESENGLAGGVEGGIPGGQVGGALPPGPTEAERRSLLERYLRELFRTRIAARFRYPPEAERQGIEGVVVLRVAIDGAGRLLQLRVVGACTHRVLCEAASETLLASTPFPPPPAELGGTIAVDVPLAYRLE
jgi:periplasmic protein TonB